MRWISGLILAVAGIITIAACNSSSRASTQELLFAVPTYDPANAVRPDAPAPVDGDFRYDNAARIPLQYEIYGDEVRPYLIMFFSDICGNCIAMRPLIHALEAEYWGRVDFIYLAYDDIANFELVHLFDVRDVPFFALNGRDGYAIQVWQGAPPLEDLHAAIESALRDEAFPE
ncbi:MAG TPA: thioredoxin domain-containing protein [Aggregatilineales bacterium]|nr:thioredoxin domain-containing protein [Aggregatilineales bacterium]